MTVSDHLPECEWNDETRVNRHCICAALRACEARVRDDSEQWGVKAGYAAALDRARDAVAALEPLLNKGKREGGYDCCGCSSPNDLYDDALAAIDALKEEKP